MAGSIKWFVYTSDDGSDYAFRADESNIEAINGENGDYTDTSDVPIALPRNITPRRARYSNTERTVTRTVIVVNPTIYNAIVTGTGAQSFDVNVEGTTYTLGLVSTIGESFVRPTPVDTGQTDGDPT